MKILTFGDVSPKGLIPLLQQNLSILISHLKHHVKQLVYWKPVTLENTKEQNIKGPLCLTVACTSNITLHCDRIKGNMKYI